MFPLFVQFPMIVSSRRCDRPSVWKISADFLRCFSLLPFGSSVRFSRANLPLSAISLGRYFSATSQSAVEFFGRASWFFRFSCFHLVIRWVPTLCGRTQSDRFAFKNSRSFPVLIEIGSTPVLLISTVCSKSFHRALSYLFLDQAGSSLFSFHFCFADCSLFRSLLPDCAAFPFWGLPMFDSMQHDLIPRVFVIHPVQCFFPNLFHTRF